ncbi:hypothetical protein E2562_010894 [Oryza meyeriana var. granulata]|uniref:Uncharacterized protein n=1 Tax=Oryza meyeriana var. granulata TaxID=110450 RepID=A0A6G1BVD7_9ORYZ|nr:hypothetical protein E2562_010894 [Oryza meyeriana var. granulata]
MPLCPVVTVAAEHISAAFIFSYPWIRSLSLCSSRYSCSPSGIIAVVVVFNPRRWSAPDLPSPVRIRTEAVLR